MAIVAAYARFRAGRAMAGAINQRASSASGDEEKAISRQDAKEPVGLLVEAIDGSGNLALDDRLAEFSKYLRKV